MKNRQLFFAQIPQRNSSLFNDSLCFSTGFNGALSPVAIECKNFVLACGSMTQPCYKPKTDKVLTYFIEAVDTGFVKIGICGDGDVQRRVSEMQTGCPFELRLLASIRGNSALEYILHERFKALRHRREWFHLEGELQSLIGSIQRRNRRDMRSIFKALNYDF